jgi:hypothetical protein
MNDVQRTLNALYEQRRNAQRGLERAKKAGDQIGAKREQNKIKQLDGEIRNLL